VFPIEPSKLQLYLLAVNAAGFLLALLNGLLRKKTGRRMEVLLCLASAAGGALGVLLGILLFDRKADKENMMTRVWTLCLLIIQVLALLFLRGGHQGPLNWDLWAFLAEHRPLSFYLLVINVLTFCVFGLDKYLAIAQRRRVPIVTLLGLSFLGGSVGGLLAMVLFRHKTKKPYFAIGVPLILLTQLLLLFFMMNLS
jgi:uncharacterized membrane protein YsdA (DUF1294 family)